jgi:DNA-binding beta-propeller fold protein YncE
MRKQIGLLCLISMVAMGGIWFVYQAISQSSSIVRKINGLPMGQYWWFLDVYQNQLFVLDRYGNKVDITDKINLDPTPPFYVARINPDTEQVVEEFTTRQWRAIAISAEREQRPDSWLAQDYDYWVFDSQSNIAYALKPVRWDEWSEERYTGVHVVDVQTRQQKKFLEAPYVGAIALHPNREKLYVAVVGEETREIRIFSTTTLQLIKTLPYESDVPIWDMKFTRDGSRLFCCVYGRGILVIDTLSDQFEVWEGSNSAEIPVDFGIETDFSFSIALASDEKEIYVALRHGREKGRVAAIDIAQKKLVRVLELSPTACTSVVVVGDKLLAACLDGVYVIDIPSWRKQQ